MTRPEPETPLTDTFDELPEPAPNTALAGVDPGPAHGTYRPGLVSQMGLLIGRALPAGRTGLRLSGLARPLAVSGLKEGKADVKALGLKLRLHPEDNLSEKRAFLTPQCFDAAELSELRAAMGPGKTFIDIGAGAGLHALVAAKAGGPAARVIAVEPRSALRRRLAYNARANGLENVEISGAALSDYEGESVMRLVHGEGEAVRVTRLSTLLAEMKVARLDVMKIDTAGAEASILAPWFAETPRERWPGLIIMERSAGQSAENARDALFLACQRGYTVERETRSNAIVRLDVG